MGQSKSKNTNEYLIKNYPEYTAIHYKVLESLTQIIKKDCKKIDTKNEIQSLLDSWLDYHSQEEISCMVKKSLKGLDKAVDGLKIGDKNLQKIFRPLKKISSGEFGVAISTGYKGSEPFAIMKVTLGKKELYKSNLILHEIIIGLILNSLRKDTPCFSYCYGGFYCSPPLDMEKHWSTWEEKDYDKIYETFFGNWYRDLYQYLPEENEIEKDKVVVSIQNFIYKDYPYDFLIKDYIDCLDNISKMVESEWIKRRIEIKIDEIKRIDKEKILNLKERAKHLRPILQENLLCNGKEDEITSICLFEMVNDSTNLIDFINGKNRKEDIIKVMIMIYISLYIAYKKYKFLHKDLHGGNILVRKLNKETSITLRVDQKKSCTISTSFVPQVIDYGLSVMEYNHLLLDSLESEEKIESITDNDFFKDIDKLNINLRVFGDIDLPNEIKDLPSDLEEFLDRLFQLV